MAIGEIIIQVFENFVFSTTAQKVFLLFLVVGNIMHLSSFLTTRWVEADAVSFGLWDQCNYEEEYSCCESVDRYLGATKSATVPAWLGASRTFQCFGLVLSVVSTATTVLRILVTSTRDSKPTAVISTTSTFAAATCILIGVFIFGGEYRKNAWLFNSHLSISFGACVTSGIMFAVCGIILVVSGNAKKERVINIKKDFIYPNTWKPMKENENLRLENVQQDSQEYKNVVQLFNTSSNYRRMIIEIKRIQNKSLYQQYSAEKEKLEKSNPHRRNNERHLWHGTSNTATSSINRHGFDRGYCGKNATVYGKGVYFAVSAEVSASDVYSVKDYHGYKHMYLCRVLTGDYTVGQSFMTVAPGKFEQPPGVIFDSVVDNLNDPSIFVIFSDHKAYPEYLITFLPFRRF